jgi:hypothetical protein
MENALIALCGFLGGSLLTSLWYSFGMARDIIRVTTRSDDHIKNHPVCEFHPQMLTDIKEREQAKCGNR